MGVHGWGLKRKRFLRVIQILFTPPKVLSELLSKHYKLAKLSAYLWEKKKIECIHHILVSPYSKICPSYADCNVHLTAHGQGQPSTQLNIWLQDFLSSSTPFNALNNMKEL